MCGLTGTTAGMATLTPGTPEGGNSHHGRMPGGWRIAGFTAMAATFWLKGVGARSHAQTPHAGGLRYPACGLYAVTNMTMVAISITPAHIHPSQRSRGPFRRSPMTSALLVSSTTRTNKGGANAPLSTADQKSILMAFRPA